MMPREWGIFGFVCAYVRNATVHRRTGKNNIVGRECCAGGGGGDGGDGEGGWRMSVVGKRGGQCFVS